MVIDLSHEALEMMQSHIRDRHLQVDYISLTHEHFDHISGVDALRKEQGCPLVSSQACNGGIVDPTVNLSKYWEGGTLVCTPADIILEDIEFELEWCDTKIRYFLTPGHSIGSVCIAIEDYLFTGDTLLAGLKTVTKIPGSNKVALAKSLRFLFNNFEAETIIYPGHGAPFPLRSMNYATAMGSS